MLAPNGLRPATAETVNGALKVRTGKRVEESSKPNTKKHQAPQLELHIGGRRTGIAIQRDAAYPGMWRVLHGDELSDIANISRAKDAAITWARPRGLGGGEVAHWHRRESRAGAPPMRQNGAGR